MESDLFMETGGNLGLTVNIYTSGEDEVHLDSASISSHDGETSQPTAFSCDICSKSYSSIGSWRTHRFGHHCVCNETDSKGKPRLCYFCARKKKSGPEKNNICLICSKAFASFQSMRKHQLKYHIGREEPEKCFQCPFCPRSFAREAWLEIHVASHPGDKPFSCNECGKGFVRKLGLQRHLLIHDRELGDYTPHTCEKCKKTFPSKSQRNLHYRTHEKPFACDKCLESFNNKSQLAYHKSRHHGEYMFVK